MFNPAKSDRSSANIFSFLFCGIIARDICCAVKSKIHVTSFFTASYIK